MLASSERQANELLVGLPLRGVGRVDREEGGATGDTTATQRRFTPAPPAHSSTRGGGAAGVCGQQREGVWALQRCPPGQPVEGFLAHSNLRTDTCSLIFF